jgi:uncharacterized protein
MTFHEYLASIGSTVPPAGADAVLALVAEGHAPLFVARRRQDRTGGLGEAEVRAVLEARERWDALHERQRFVTEEIARQGRLTPELRATIESTFDRDALDDLYVPFKRKRRTPAAAAVEAGLGPLADWIWNCGHGLDTPLPGQTLELWAFTFRSEEHGIGDAAAAIAGATDILVERLAETASLRARLRATLQHDAWVVTRRGERAKDGGRFTAFFDAQVSATSLGTPAEAEHYLAIRRGVNEGELVMRLDGGPEDPRLLDRLCGIVHEEACTVADSPGAEVLARAAIRAFEEHLLPAAEAAVHKALRTVADEVALEAIEAEARALLLGPPFGARPVLAVDPSIRGGCKVAVVDATGRPLEHAVVHIDGEEKRAKSGEALAELAQRHGAEAVAIGDGLASKETLRFVRGALRERGVLVPVVVVPEVGLGTWAASDLARDELPDLDARARAAVGIARRLQDPLAELVKAEPKTLAGGPYVHDCSQPRLEKTLAAVVATAVADVGVDVNAAADVLLARVPGATPGLAHAIVEHRTTHGPFESPAALRAVPLMDARTFEQMEPFVRVGGDPARPDPRGVLDPPAFHSDVRSFATLQPGLTCPGIVTNVTAFGAFVDIGLPHDGLVHVSRLASEFVKDPHAVVRVGDRVEVRVVEVNREKQQITLSMRPDAPPRRMPPHAAAPRERDERRQEQREDRRPQRPEPRRDRPQKPRPERERPGFNNPFAGLAAQLRGTPTDRSKGPSS